MFKPAHFTIVLTLLCIPFIEAQATTYKCLDGRKVTYANMPCEELGLTSAGPVKNKVTVMPATPTGNKQESAKQPKPAEQDAEKFDPDDERIPRETGIKPVNPLVKKMLDM